MVIETNPLAYLLRCYPLKPWDWVSISYNPGITMELICKNPNKPWNWYWISQNPGITMEMILQNPYRPWDWYEILGILG